EYLPEHLFGCEKFECVTSRKEKGQSNIVFQKIIGVNKEGLCVHEQTTENSEKIICQYEKESRKFLSIKMQDAKTGKLGNTPEDIEYSEALIGEIFYNECEVFDKSGKKLNFSEVEQQEPELDFKTIARKLKKEELDEELLE
ncbi:MAG TPA: hypothetical protein DIV86_06710, partial [Alphaproteobacteria bacterium]|nr:hypothetical protein [Alphaproteobacteria bacterium]